MTIRLHTPLLAHFPDIAEVARIFFPEAQVLPAGAEEADLRHGHRESDGWAEDRFTWGESSFTWTTRIEGDLWERKRLRKRGVKQCCYYLLKAGTGAEPPWGSLTGVRPTRLFYERLAKGDKPGEAREQLARVFDLREDRAQLLQDTVAVQRGLAPPGKNAVDVYVGIPFCSTRCAYCSFFTEAVGKGRKVEPYLEALFAEIDAAAEIVRRAELAPRALYVGGGTPTALSAEALDRLLARLAALFPAAKEWTVEAGRPDTLDGDKLALMRRHGVGRLCINPQTMNNETLRAIGRNHTDKDVQAAFMLAREAGFAHINMDVIAALPGEGTREFKRTLDAVAALLPDSLTVHTLARKHGSRFNEVGFDPVPGRVAEEMVEMGAACAHRMGMRPYYLYRQKYAAGNLENVAYARPGCESLYNVDVMEETVSVLAVGAGAISKRVFQGGARIERAPNAGDIGHYISRVHEMIDRKRALFDPAATGPEGAGG